MPVKKPLLWSIFAIVTTTMCYVDSIASFHERVRWLALGDDIKEDTDNRVDTEIERFNMSTRVSTMIEFSYRTKNEMKINCIIATAAKMNGFVSLEKGGLDEDHVTIRYITENGAEDDFFVFIESYKIKSIILNDNVANIKNVAVVMNDIRNWTEELVQEFIHHGDNNKQLPVFKPYEA